MSDSRTYGGGIEKLIQFKRIVGVTSIALGLLHLAIIMPNLDLGPARAVTHFLAGLGAVVVGLVCIGVELTLLVTAPIRNFLEGLYMPRDRNAKPPVSYTLGDSYFRQSRYDDALAEYCKILHYHPREFAAYQSALYIVTAKRPDRNLAVKLFRQAGRRLRDTNQKAAILQWERLGEVPLREALESPTKQLSFTSSKSSG